MHAYVPVAASVLDRDTVLDSLSPDKIQRHANIINHAFTSHTFEHQHGLRLIFLYTFFSGRDDYFSSNSWGDTLSGF